MHQISLKNKEYWINEARHDWDKSRLKGNIFERIYFSKKIKFISSIFNYKNKTVLDLGCATGICTFDIAKNSQKTIGMDISLWALKKAQNKRKKQDKNIKFLAGDAEKLPFKDNTFDIVVNTALLQYFHDSRAMVDEMERVLKPNGQLLVEVPYKYGFYNIKSLIRFLTSKKDFLHEPINRCYSKKEFKRIFSRFKLVKIYNFYNILLFGIFQRRYG